MRVVFSCDSVPTYPPEVRYPRCAPPPRKAVLSVNGRSPDENGDVDLRKDFADLLPGDDMTLSEVGSKVNEVVRKLNPGAESGTGHGGPAEPYGPDTVLGDVRPSSTLKEISDAVPSFSPDGKLPVKALPKYLHEISFDDTYKDDAEAWYARLGSGAFGACSAVRRGDRLFRNYDWTFGFAAEFVVRMSAAAGRHASVGVASLGDALTEDEAASGVYTSKFRALPGMTLDGINDAGVVAEINVDGGPKTNWHGSGDDSIHILAAVRWVLDHGETAAQAAAYVADHVRMPEGDVNFHFMIADATSTYIVENGAAHEVTVGEKVLTNYALYDASHAGGGKERYRALADGADITSVRFTNAYSAGNGWDSDFGSPGQHAEAIRQWAAQGEDKEAHRGKTTSGGKSWWQTVHTAEYDFTAKTLKVAVQEQDEWFAFSVVESVPDDYASVRADAAKGASHADETGNPHGTTASDVSFSEGVSVASAIQSVSEAFGNHASDMTAHVTESDRTAWDDKYTRQEVDDKITRFVAHYLTDKVDGRFVPFATHARLAEAKAQHTEANPRFFYAGTGFTPTKNDYCVVLSDETYGGKTTRYSFVGVWGEDGKWQYQYTINDTAFSAEQWAAINSLTSVDGDGNLCFDGIPIVDSAGKLIAGLTGEDIPVSSEDATKVADAIAAKRGLTDLDVYKESEVLSFRFESENADLQAGLVGATARYDGDGVWRPVGVPERWDPITPSFAPEDADVLPDFEFVDNEYGYVVSATAYVTRATEVVPAGDSLAKSGEVDAKRDKLELRVFRESGRWEIAGDGLPEGLTVERYADYHPEYHQEGFAPVLNGETVGMAKGDDSSTQLSWESWEWQWGTPFTATLVKSVEPTGERLAYASEDSGLAKLGSDGKLTAASKSSDAEENADYRDPLDNKCHTTDFSEFEEVPREGGYHLIVRINSLPEWTVDGWRAGLWIVSGDEEFVYADGTPDDLSVTFEYDGDSITAVRRRVATKDETFVTPSYVKDAAETYVITGAMAGGSFVKVNGETVTSFAALLEKCRTGRAVLYGQATTSETGYAFYNAASVTGQLIQFQVSGMLYDKSNVRYGMYVRRIKIVPRADGGLLVNDSGLEGPFAKKSETYSKGVRDNGSPVDAELHDFFTGDNEDLVETIKDKSKIDDIDDIRAGAALGTTALQSVPNLDASKINSGTFDAARIPSLDASKINSGTFDAARIPSLSAAKITTGVFVATRIPSLPTSKITSLTGFSSGQTGDLATTDTLNVALSKLQTMAKAGGGGGGGASLWGYKLTVRFDGDTYYCGGSDGSKTEIIVVHKDGTVQVSNDPNAPNVFNDVFAASIEVRGTHGGGARILPAGYFGGESVPGYVSKQWMVLTGDTDVTVSGWSECLTGDTMVAMADGSERRIDSLHAGDTVLAYDAETNELVADELVFSDADEVKTHAKTDVWTFSDGTVVKTVRDHELYNVEAGCMRYMRNWSIGEHARKIDGSDVALVSHDVVEGTVRHFKITGHHHNFFVNGILNGDRFSKVSFKRLVEV